MNLIFDPWLVVNDGTTVGATYTSPSLKLYNVRNKCKATLKVGGTFGGATVTVTIKSGTDNSTFGTTEASFTALTAAGDQAIAFTWPEDAGPDATASAELGSPSQQSNCHKYLRVNAAISGGAGDTLDIRVALSVDVPDGIVALGKIGDVSDTIAAMQQLT